MKTKILVWLLILSGISTSCTYTHMSRIIKGDDKKMNGGFEIVKESLPVNWYFYSPETVPEGDFDIIVDAANFKEGKKSVKFLVRKCTSVGGRYSPGLFNNFNAKPDETYKGSGQSLSST